MMFFPTNDKKENSRTERTFSSKVNLILEVSYDTSSTLGSLAFELTQGCEFLKLPGQNYLS